MMRSEMGFFFRALRHARTRVDPSWHERSTRELERARLGVKPSENTAPGNGNLAPVAEGPRVYLADAASAETRRAADTGEPTEERPDAEAKMNRRGF